jgi:hypothetical protein
MVVKTAIQVMSRPSFETADFGFMSHGNELETRRQHQCKRVGKDG